MRWTRRGGYKLSSYQYSCGSGPAHYHKTEFQFRMRSAQRSLTDVNKLGSYLMSCHPAPEPDPPRQTYSVSLLPLEPEVFEYKLPAVQEEPTVNDAEPTLQLGQFGLYVCLGGSGSGAGWQDIK